MTPTIREFVLAIGSSLPASIAAKATVIVVFGLMGARLARRSRAAVRHVLLAATFGVLLLLPVASLIVPPVHIAVATVRMRNASLAGPAAGSEWILPLAPSDARPAVTSTAPRSSRPPLSAFLVMGWLAGVTLALIPMIASLWKIRCLRRSGLPWADGRKVIDKLSLEAGFRRRIEILLHEELPGPIASGVLHPTILFPPDVQTWATEDLDRAAVHELEHLRRGDVVTHCLARVVCAAYWFHPLVWMAWRQLILEAERSCDDAVIARSEATAYADQLVGLARRLLAAAKSPLLAMANRSDLVIRVGAVLDTRQRRGRAGRFMVAFGCAAAVVALTMSPLRTISEPQSARAQGAVPTVASGTPLPSFEVASVKPNHSAGGMIDVEAPKGGFRATNMTAKTLIGWAYAGISVPRRDDQILGGPSWISSDRYDIDAKLEDSEVETVEKLPFEQRILQIRLRVQSLLAERFKLVVREERRELPVYALVVAKNGPKLKEAKPGDTYPNGIKGPDGRPMSLWIGVGQLTGEALPMRTLVTALSHEVGRTVLDQTGLKGNYDIALKWTPDESEPTMFQGPPGTGPRAGTPPPPDTSGPSIFTAIQEQLGLKLESQKGPEEVIVIDHIERPSAN